MTAGNVMDSAGALLNDVALSVFTYAAQIPYLNIALNELAEELEAHNVESTNQTSTSIVVTAGVTGIGGVGQPALPTGLVQIQKLWERTNGTTVPYQPMVKKEFLPSFQDQTTSLIYWIYQDQLIKFIGATSDRQVRIDYIRKIITDITAAANTIGIINARTFLTYRTAALCSQFIGENKERADELNSFAGSAIDRLLSTEIKAKQSISTRRKPFMAAYKLRSGV